MPDGIPWISMSEILTFEEICRITEAAASQGIRHIKITGGEPLVRKGCPELIGMLKKIPGIEKVTITTNGMLLGQYLAQLVDAGVDGINISLDTLNRQWYERLTGTDGLRMVMEGIAQASGLSMPVKVNAVSLNIDEMFGSEEAVNERTPCGHKPNWQRLAELARHYPVDVRFIELMPIGYGKDFPPLSNAQLYTMLLDAYPQMEPDERNHGPGPAVYYQIPGFQGSVGFISAIHGKFCDSCNRVRLTSQGYLKTCLCYEDGVDLREILRSELTAAEKREGLIDAMQGAILKKPAAHCFERPDLISEKRKMSAIGG
jgi:cyclic pyranopterin phosphate synthase